jgi:hypothetical protein
MKKLQNAIDQVNKRYSAGLNDDDQIAIMIAIDKTTKGYTFQPRYDTYELVTDYNRLKFLANKDGYWSESVEYFNGILIQKGGASYKDELNNKLIGENKDNLTPIN